ncbi:hypothetical protein [Vibrio tubiashii]|uniref:hypothetical protein n=1 Tax=Vibrio tubiashii TaxID=29498 RepID=UPI00349E8336
MIGYGLIKEHNQNNKVDAFEVRKVNLLITFSFLFVSLLIYIFQYHIEFFGHIGFGGMFIADTLGMQGNIIRGVENGIDASYKTILGVFYLYYLSYWLGDLYCYLVNSLLLIISSVFFLKTLEKIRLEISIQKICIIFFLSYCNFYLMGALFHPNKEIPLIALTNLFIYNLVGKGRVLIPFFISLLVLTFRDAFSLILIMSIFAVRANVIFRVCSRRPFLVLFLAVLFLSFFNIKYIASLGLLHDYNYILERNVLPSEQVSQWPYIIKLFNNAFGSALRPQPIDFNGRFNFIGLGLWQFGIVLFFGVLSWFKMLQRGCLNKHASMIVISIFICLIFVSLGSIPQPRYMMPYVFWLSLGIVLVFRFDVFVVSVILLSFLSFVIYALGFGMNVPFGLDTYSL